MAGGTVVAPGPLAGAHGVCACATVPGVVVVDALGVVAPGDVVFGTTVFGLVAALGAVLVPVPVPGGVVRVVPVPVPGGVVRVVPVPAPAGTQGIVVGD